MVVSYIYTKYSTVVCYTTLNVYTTLIGMSAVCRSWKYSIGIVVSTFNWWQALSCRWTKSRNIAPLFLSRGDSEAAAHWLSNGTMKMMFPLLLHRYIDGNIVIWFDVCSSLEIFTMQHSHCCNGWNHPILLSPGLLHMWQSNPRRGQQLIRQDCTWWSYLIGFAVLTHMHLQGHGSGCK